tara:strand:+ start:481 stop:1869 length:1389 start_codon:yes stop_codon:yes gene_type:complete
MADSTSNIYIDISSDGATMATDFGKGSEVGLTASHVSLTKMVWGDYNDNKRVTLGNPIPIQWAGQTGPVDIAGNMSGTTGSSFPIKNYGQDGSGSSGALHYVAVAGSTNGVSPVGVTGTIQGILNGIPIEITGDVAIRGSLDAPRGVAIQGTSAGYTAEINGEVYPGYGYGIPVAVTAGRRLHSDTDSVNVVGTINSTGGRQLTPATDAVQVWGYDQGQSVHAMLRASNDGVTAGFSGDALKVAVTNGTFNITANVSAVVGVTNASEPPLRIQGYTASAQADPVIVRGENNGALEIVSTSSLSTTVSNIVDINDDDVIAYLGGPSNSSVTTSPIVDKLTEIEKDTDQLQSIRADLSSGKIKATVAEIERPSTFQAKLATVRPNAGVMWGSIILRTGATIKAHPNNEANMLVGDATLQNSYKNGYLLEPGESIFIEINNINKIYIMTEPGSSPSNDVCHFICS